MPPSVAEPLPSFADAYRAAKEAHAAEAASTETPPGTPVETGEPELGHEEGPDDGDVVLETADQVAEDTPETPGRRGAEAETGIVSDTDLKALQTKYKDNPGRLLAELNKAWTQKTQALAADRKQYEAVKAYLPMFEQLESDPAGTIQRLAAHFDITLPAAAKVLAAVADRQPAARAEAVVDVVESELAAVRADLGPELEYLADGLVPAITKMVERLVGKQIQPLRRAQDTQNVRAAGEETERVMTALETRHPDWHAHEPAMLELAKTLDPKGLTEAAYLDVLYDVVTSREGQSAWEKDKATQVAAEVKKTLAKMEADATKGRTPRATPGGRVTAQAPARPTFREAFQAAKAGQRFE